MIKTFFWILLLPISSAVEEPNNLFYNSSEIVYFQNEEKTFHLDFPTEPQVFSETMELRGYPVNITFYMSMTDSGSYSLFELELGDLKEDINQHASNFFNGMVTYIINDIGAEVGAFSDFEYEGYKGNNFNIITPNTESKENITSKGKTLLIDDRAYIWFGISEGNASDDRVNQFLESYSLK